MAITHPSPAPFDVEVRPDRDRVVVAPSGEIDLSTVDVLRTRIEELEAAGSTRLVLDLRRVSFLDTTGLRLIVEQARRPDVDLSLIAGEPPVQRIFEITGLLDSLPFVPQAA
jgi:anti-sigma B factor antagonist